MIAWRSIGLLVGSLLALVLMVVFTGSLTGDMAGLWREIRWAVFALAGVVGLFSLFCVWMTIMRVRGRAAREITRYQLLLSQADEATHEELAAATDALVQAVRATLISRVFSGQPWIAFELWHDPSANTGETGRSVLFLLVEAGSLPRVLSALRRVSPNLTVRHDRDEGAPIRFSPPDFTPMHVLRVKKARGWELPIASRKGSADGSNARSVSASIVRQQQDLGREGFVSCVRVCIMPADDSVDRRAASRLRRMAQRETNANAAISADILEAQQGGGGTLSFVEFQAAIEYKGPATDRTFDYSERQTLCKQLLGPGMSHRSVNTLVERNVILRQRMYCRRWARATPPLLPDQSGATLMFPNELSALIEFATLAAEHDLPFGRNTIPYLPAPLGLARARMIDMPTVPPDSDAPTQATEAPGPEPGPAAHDPAAQVFDDSDDEDVEVLDGEFVNDQPSWRRQRPRRARAEEWQSTGPSPAPLPQLPPGEPSPGLATGAAQPNVKWTLNQRDRARGVLIAGGQGSGKTSKLIRLAMDDALSPNTALVVLDMKGSMSERLLREIPTDVPKRYYDHAAQEWRDGVKRVWYLDLAAPAFGLTPLHIEAGWRKRDLPDLFVQIASVVLSSLSDVFAGQIFRSSEDIIERAVIGTMAIAWHQHDEYHRAAGRDPEQFGFSGSFKVLVRMFGSIDHSAPRVDRNAPLPPNPWHEAAGRACQRIPGMAEMADFLLVELPGQIRTNISNMETKLSPPRNKLGPLVYSQAPVRRFVEHRERLSLASVLQAHDILIVNPRKEILGDASQPEILVNFMIHMLNQELNRQLAVPQPTRPRVSVVIDEAHTLITPSLMKMVSTHREAGMSIACATQYMAQIGATLENRGDMEYVQHGVTNLLQTKMFGRMADPGDAEVAAGVFRSVWESLTRSDPTSQARIPVDASNITTIEDWHFFVHVISSGNPDQAAVGANAATSWGGSTALPVFVSRAFPMDELHEIPNTYRKEHLARMAAVFGTSTEDTSDQVPQVPPGLRAGTGAHVVTDHDDAADVARSTVGRKPERRPSRARDGDAVEWHAPVDDAVSEDAVPPGRPQEETVGGARIQRSPDTPAVTQRRVLPLFEFALKPTDTPPPDDEVQPHSERLREAVMYAASIEQLAGVGAWTTAGDDVVADTTKAAGAAAESERILARTEGASDTEAERRAKAAAAAVRRDALAKYVDQDWRQQVRDLKVSSETAALLRLLNQLPYSHPSLLATLMSNPPQTRRLARALNGLEEQGLVASAPVRIAGRGGRPVTLYTATRRGREFLRRDDADTGADNHDDERADKRAPGHLKAERKLPNDGAPMDGDGVPHALAVQLALGALHSFGGTQMKCRWMTPDMRGGRLSITMVHEKDHVVHMRDLLPPDSTGLAVLNDRSDAAGIIEPDVTVALDGQLADRRRHMTLLLEVDRTRRPSYNAGKMIAYDHFLAGWCMWIDKFGRDSKHRQRPLVVFVSHDEKSARTLLKKADDTMTVGVGLPGQDPRTYQYYGRTHTVFTCLPWLLAGQAYALTMPDTPPLVRGRDAAWDPEPRALVPEAWWPREATSATRTQHRRTPVR